MQRPGVRRAGEGRGRARGRVRRLAGAGGGRGAQRDPADGAAVGRRAGRRRPAAPDRSHARPRRATSRTRCTPGWSAAAGCTTRAGGPSWTNEEVLAELLEEVAGRHTRRGPPARPQGRRPQRAARARPSHCSARRRWCGGRARRGDGSVSRRAAPRQSGLPGTCRAPVEALPRRAARTARWSTWQHRNDHPGEQAAQDPIRLLGDPREPLSVDEVFARRRRRRRGRHRAVRRYGAESRRRRRRRRASGTPAIRQPRPRCGASPRRSSPSFRYGRWPRCTAWATWPWGSRGRRRRLLPAPRRGVRGLPEADRRPQARGARSGSTRRSPTAPRNGSARSAAGGAPRAACRRSRSHSGPELATGLLIRPSPLA